MRLEEFVKYAEQYIEAITTVYKLVHSKEETLDEIVRFQNIAANALGPIDHILDIYADRRTQFGEGNREVDKFRESLTIYGMCGSGIIEYAIGEMKLVMAKLSRLQSVNPHLELPEPLHYINMLPPPTNFGSSVEQGVKELLSLFPFEKNVFIMMPFGDSSTKADSLVKLTLLFDSIERTLKRFYGFNALRADFRDFSRSGWLWDNVCVYALGSKYGIAVLESFSAEEFNPNVAMEFGFMKALGREVLLLKDKNFKHVRADILGRLWIEFDSTSKQSIEETIEDAIHKWLVGKSTRIL